MLTKFMALLIAGTALTGCCASGTGCSDADGRRADRLGRAR